MNLYRQLERELFPFVEKPGRYSGGELNAVIKDPADVKLMGVLCFPELYDVGMSHFGSQILYHIVNRTAQWAVGRTYMPWLDAEELMRKNNIPLYSLEYFQPMKEADWVGFSMQYELQYANLVNILDLAGIPFYSKDRTEEDPILIAGGPSMANPEPVAPFLDVIFPGDGEDIIVQFCETLERLKEQGASRAEKLAELAKIEGAYIPSLYKEEKQGSFVVPIIDEEHRVVVASKIPEFRPEDSPKKQVVPLVDVIHHRMAVEVMRGCTRGCRFCSAGYYYRPVRERPVEQIADQIRSGIETTGWADVGLLSLSTADYSQFGELLCASGEEVGKSGIKVSLPSTRIDAVTEDEFGLLDKLSPASSLTIAPEAGSQRLRNVINKDFSRETIIEMVHKLMQNNITTLKLYFMVGLPTETEEDIDELIELVNEISNIVWAVEHRRTVSVALSPFSPKSHTPFQWEALCDTQVAAQRSKRIKHTLRKKRNVKVEYRDTRMTFLETIMTRGDRSLAPLIVEAWKDGSRFEGWNDQFDLQRWLDCAERLGIDITPFVSEIPEDQPLPWQAISMGLSTKFLQLERKKAYNEATTIDCRDDNCRACGVCGDELDMNYATDGDASKLNEIAQKLADTKKRQPSGDKHFLRLRYTKNESVRFLSHRNVVDIFDRAFKAAKVPLSLSEGYKPRPRVSYGPPLPLAAIGENELMDLQVHGEEPLNVEKIQTYLPEGLKIIGVQEFPGKTKAITSQITAADWQITPLLPMDDADLAKRVEEFLAKDSVVVSVEKKQKMVEIEIRDRVIDLSSGEGRIDVRVSMAEGKACRPSDVVAALFPEYTRYDFLMNRIKGVHIESDGTVVTV